MIKFLKNLSIENHFMKNFAGLPCAFYIFFTFREQAPTSSKLNAVDLYLVVCVFFVFGKLSIFTLAIHNYLLKICFATFESYLKQCNFSSKFLYKVFFSKLNSSWQFHLKLSWVSSIISVPVIQPDPTWPWKVSKQLFTAKLVILF